MFLMVNIRYIILDYIIRYIIKADVAEVIFLFLQFF